VSLMLCICAPVVHRELRTPCNRASWLWQGQSRFELVASLLQTRQRIPVLICEAPNAKPNILSRTKIVSAPVGLGEHVHLEGHRTHAGIPCPSTKELMAPLLRAMIEHRSTYHLNIDELTEYRMWRAAQSHLWTGMGAASSSTASMKQPERRSSLEDAWGFRVAQLSSSHIELPQEQPDRRSGLMDAWGFQETAYDRRSSYGGEGDGDSSALKAFLLNYRFMGATDYGTRGDGLPPLMCAAFEGNTGVVLALLEARADPNRAYQGRTLLPHLALSRGTLPLHVAVSSHSSNEATVHALLTHGADPNATIGDLALTPLVGSVFLTALRASAP